MKISACAEATFENAGRGESRRPKIISLTRKGRRKRRSYTVQPGDTLASIARKFYKSSARWSTIMEANSDTISKPSDLKPGQTLVIP